MWMSWSTFVTGVSLASKVGRGGSLGDSVLQTCGSIPWAT